MHSNKQASDRNDSVMLTIFFFKIQGLYCTLFQNIYITQLQYQYEVG